MQARVVSTNPIQRFLAVMHDIANRLTPVSFLHSRANRGMARIFIQSHFLAAAASFATVLYLLNTAEEAQVAFYILCFSVIIFAALPFALRRSGDLALVALISFQTLAVASFAGIFDYGSLASPFLPWLLVTLMSGLFYQSKRAGLVLGLFIFDVAVFFAVLVLRTPPQLVAAEDLRLLSWISIAVAMAYMAFMALYYARIIASRSELELEAERYRTASVELEQASAMAEKVSRNRSLFFSKMSHELRTPLNAVINYSEILLEDCEDSASPNVQRKADLRRINATGKHLLSLVSDVFDMENIERESVAVDVRRFTLGELCDAVTANAQPLFETNANRLVVDCPIRSDEISTDGKKLRQMLLNLLSNAAKFTSEGTITLELWIERGLADSRLHAAVKDTGMGIAPDVLPRLFETYMQADPTIYGRYGGTGIGLALTRKFSVLLGGEIAVASRLGEGSTFTVDIPAELTTRTDTSDSQISPVTAQDGANRELKESCINERRELGNAEPTRRTVIY